VKRFGRVEVAVDVATNELANIFRGEPFMYVGYIVVLVLVVALKPAAKSAYETDGSKSASKPIV
jgi:hypothetical protein